MSLKRPADTDKENLRSSLVDLYKIAGPYVTAAVTLFLVTSLFIDIKATPVQLIAGVYSAIIIGTPAFVISRAKLKTVIMYFHYALIFGIVGVYIIDYTLHPGTDELITLFLGVFCTSLIIIRTRMAIIFFSVITLVIGFIYYQNDDFSTKLVLYYVILIAAVISINHWRQSLYNFTRLSNKTYKELFSQSTELIFVLNKNLEILDLNHAAEDYIQQYGNFNYRGKEFNQMFCGQTEEDQKNFQDAINAVTGGHPQSRFEANCDFQGNKEFVPKEFTITTADYFDQTVLVVGIRIITERKKYENELIEGREKMGQVLENINSYVFNIVYDTKGNSRVNYVSKKVKEILGIYEDEYIARVKSSRISELYHPEDRDWVNEEFDRMLELNEPITRIFRLKQKPGVNHVRWLEEKIFPQKIEGTTKHSLFGIVTDVSERMVAQKKLEESEARYRQIFERNMAGVYKTHVDGRILDCNDAFARILGYEGREELISKPVSQIYFDDKDRSSYIERLRKEKALNNHTTILRSKQGEKLIAINNVGVFPDENGELNVIEGTLIDVTERNKYENELEESKRSFQNIVDSSPAAILIFSENKLIYSNPVGEKVMEEHLNKDATEIEGYFPEETRYILRDVLNDVDNDINSYTEISLGQKQFSINVVNTRYNNQEAQMIILRDITLQTEYNVQRLRAEMAEESNKMLQEEIERHKQTQRNLLEQTSRLNALFESSGNLFIVSLDKDFQLSGTNENFKKFVKKELGKTVIIGNSFLDHFETTPDARVVIEKKLADVLSGQTHEMISHFPGKSGEIWMESFINPIIVDGQIEEISFISHNITEKVESEKRLKASEANNRAILLAIPDMLFKVDRNGVFTDVRIIDAEERKIVEQLTTVTNLIGSKVVSSFKDNEIAEIFMNFIERSFKSDEVLTHTYHFYYKNTSGEAARLYFENRYSKTSDDEVIIVVRNVTETMEYEARLIESVQEKEVLLKEVHHRVKNNLQVINSILNLQSSYIEDPKTLEIINESQNRIRSMSYIHEILYQTKNFSSVDFSDYITNLIQNIIHSYEIYNEATQLVLEVDHVNLALDQAIPCGLILNELVSNALKYAYPDKEKGKIVIQVFEENNLVSLKVQDFGIGLPKNIKPEETETLGLSLVHTLVEQLDGELIVKTNEGTDFLIIFEKQEF